MKVAVTGLNNIDSPGPGVPFTRGIRDSEDFNGQIIGLIYDGLEPGAYMVGVADKSYLIPYPSSGIENLFERINYIHSIEKIDVIVPTLDAELFAFTKLSQRLEDIGIKTFLPTTDQLTIRSKDKLFEFCKRNEITAPKNILATSIQDLYKIPSELNYPVAIKGIFYDAYIVNNFDEAVTAFNKISAKWGMPIIIQEFIRGDEYNVCALGDGEGRTIGSVAMKKTFITDKGKAWGGITIDDPTIGEISSKIIEAIDWKGGAEFEFVKEKESGNFYLLEINPRFPAWVYLTVGAGQNQPMALLKMAMGEKVKPMTEYEIGKMFIRYSWDLIADIKQFEELTVNGSIKVKALPQSLEDTKEHEEDNDGK